MVPLLPAADIFGSAARVLVELTLTPELAKNTVGLHGIFHGIGQKECGGILQDPVSFRFIVNKQLSVVVEDFGKEYRFGVKGRRWQWKRRPRSVPGWSHLL